MNKTGKFKYSSICCIINNNATNVFMMLPLDSNDCLSINSSFYAKIYLMLLFILHNNNNNNNNDEKVSVLSREFIVLIF